MNQDLSQESNGPNFSMILLIALIFGAIAIWSMSAYYKNQDTKQLAATERVLREQREADLKSAQSRDNEQRVIKDAVALGRRSYWDRFAKGNG